MKTGVTVYYLDARLTGYETTTVTAVDGDCIYIALAPDIRYKPAHGYYLTFEKSSTSKPMRVFVTEQDVKNKIDAYFDEKLPRLVADKMKTVTIEQLREIAKILNINRE